MGKESGKNFFLFKELRNPLAADIKKKECVVSSFEMKKFLERGISGNSRYIFK